jgi:hypothetical protein
MQGHREDPIGELARRWIYDSAGQNLVVCETWLSEIREHPKWSTAVQTAEEEFAVAADYLSRGESAPTFPKIFASEEYEAQLQQSVEMHKAESELSADAYLRRRHFALQRALEDRKLIYLDINHWINLRHIFIGSPQARPEYARILRLLDKLTTSGRAVCPISFPLFSELMTQGDSNTRRATACLMQAFSGGVCFQFPDELQKLEFRQRALRALLGPEAPELNEWIWTKVGYVSGELLPDNKAFSEADNNFIRKVSIDAMWIMPLEALVEMDEPSKTGAEELLAHAMNEDAAWYRNQKLRFSKVLEYEKAYLVARLKKEFDQISKELGEDYPQYRDVSKLPRLQAEQIDPWALPSIQVLAGINAALILASKKFSSNDILDFLHAALAVPYCDALACDRRIANILLNKQLDFGRIYGTEIFSRPEEIRNYLERLL